MAYTRLKELEHFEDNTCFFCKQNQEDELVYGKIYQYGDIITHYFCMLFSSGMEQNGEDEEGILGFLPTDIRKELERSLKITCSFCNHEGASISCSVKSCKKRFHYPCAVNNGSLHQFFGQFRSFCHNHRRTQIVPAYACKRGEKTTCLICLDEVLSTVAQHTIWSPCCKTAWFHRVCIQKMAVEHGYFFKCPNCKNDNVFRDEMRECGIYIPDRDASWELEPNAFQELNERHSHCDAERCYCPRGRNYAPPDGVWEVILCALCGSHGIHVQCGKVKMDDNDQWICSLCSTVSTSILPRPDPGPSEIRQSGTARRGRKRKRKTLLPPSDDSGSAKKVVCPQETSSESGDEESGPCLFGNSGEPIKVVHVDSAKSTGEKVVEIGGVVELETVELDSDDDCELSGANSLILTHSTDKGNEEDTIKIDSTTNDCKNMDIIVIDDSEDESNTTVTASTNDGGYSDEDDDLIFVSQQIPEKTWPDNNISSAMIRIVQNDRVCVVKPTDVKKTNPTSSQNNLNGCSNRPSNVIWQSVPLHKSIVHPPSQSQVVSSTNAGNNFKQANHPTIPASTQKLLPGTLSKSADQVKPVTKEMSIREYLTSWKQDVEVINVD